MSTEPVVLNKPVPAMFPFADVFGLLSRYTVSSMKQKPTLPNGKSTPDRNGPMDGIIDLVEYVTGETFPRGKWTRDETTKFIADSSKAAQILSKPFWYLSDIKYPENLKDVAAIDAWVAKQAALYSEYLPVYTAKQYSDPNLDVTSAPPASFSAKFPKRDPLIPDGTGPGRNKAN